MTGTDNLTLAKTLAHQEGAMSGLNSRVTGLETGLAHVNEKVSGLDSRVAQGFGEVLSQIREGKAARGPGLGDTIKMTVGLVSLGAAAVVVVTYLVTATVEPKLQKLTDTADRLVGFRDRDEEDRRREYERLKEERKNKVDGTIEKLAEQLKEIEAKAGWGTVTVDRGRR